MYTLAICNKRIAETLSFVNNYGSFLLRLSCFTLYCHVCLCISNASHLPNTKGTIQKVKHSKGSLTLAMGKCLLFSVKIKVCQSSLSSS